MDKKILKIYENYKNVCKFNNLTCKMSDNLVKYSHGEFGILLLLMQKYPEYHQYWRKTYEYLHN